MFFSKQQQQKKPHNFPEKQGQTNPAGVAVTKIGVWIPESGMCLLPCSKGRDTIMAKGQAVKRKQIAAGKIGSKTQKSETEFFLWVTVCILPARMTLFFSNLLIAFGL